MKVYSYSSCGTCRKAINWLKSYSFTFELIDILKSPPKKKELILAANKLGDRKYLFNTSGMSYRSIGADVIRKMSNDEAFEILSQDPKLIKRPFLVTKNGDFLIGFKKDLWAKLLLSP